MKKLARSLVGCVIGAVAVVGCGSDVVPLAEFGEETAETYCGVLEECYGPEILELFAGTDCVSTFRRTFDEQTYPRYEQAIADGTLTYDGSRATACLEQVEAAGCGFIDRPTLADCEAVLEGTIAPGGACSITEQCAGAAFCSMSSMCPGTCQMQVGAGATCDQDAACTDGLRCFDGTCRSAALAGAPCEGATNPGCAGGLICQGAMEGPPGGMSTSGTCVSPAEIQTAMLGDACNPMMGPFCQPGISCGLTGVAGTMANFECVEASPSGGTCNLGFPDPCPSAEYCDATPFMPGGSFEGTCQTLPTDGEACIQGRCAEGHRCEGTTCQSIGSIGAACTTDPDCYSGNCASGTCAAGILCE